jgi:hypothetical protein
VILMQLFSRDSIVGRYVNETTGWTVRVPDAGGGKTFSALQIVRPALGPTQPIIQWVPVCVPRAKAAGG